MKEISKLTVLSEHNNEVCPGCQKKVKGRGNIPECKYADIAEIVWFWFNCKKKQEADRTENAVKEF